MENLRRIYMSDVWQEDLNSMFDSFFSDPFYKNKLENLQFKHNEIPSQALSSGISENLQNLKFNYKQFKSARKLSYASNSFHPGFAKILKIRENQKFGRHIVAMCNIGVGKTVLVEEHFLKSLAPSQESFSCQTCFAENVKLISCNSCSTAKFCDIECRDANQVHKIDCNTPYEEMPTNDITRFKHLVRSIILAVGSFRTAAELLHFVKDVIKDHGKVFPKDTHHFKSKYRAFLMLHPCSVGVSPISIMYAVLLLQRMEFIANRFKSAEEKRFLMNLVAHHQLIINGNAFGDDKQVSIGIFASLFNHSCAPNLINYSLGNFRCLTTIRPVRRGEQLFISYISDTTSSTMQRQLFLRNNFQFECRCDKCFSPGVSEADKLRMFHDSNYELIHCLYFTAQLISCQPFFFHSYVQKSKESVERACVEYLNRYGHLAWTGELEFVTNAYEDIHFGRQTFDPVRLFVLLLLLASLLFVAFILFMYFVF